MWYLHFLPTYSPSYLSLKQRLNFEIRLRQIIFYRSFGSVSKSTSYCKVFCNAFLSWWYRLSSASSFPSSNLFITCYLDRIGTPYIRHRYHRSPESNHGKSRKPKEVRLSWNARAIAFHAECWPQVQLRTRPTTLQTKWQKPSYQWNGPRISTLVSSSPCFLLGLRTGLKFPISASAPAIPVSAAWT